jgi:hypothetical protein
MKKLLIKTLYKFWVILVSKNLFPKLCEKLNLYINRLESK